jgi:Ca2+-transporting ATPase
MLPEPVWHTLSTVDAARLLRVDPRVGLSASETARRADVHGPNLIPEPVGRGPWRMLVEQFTDVMIVVLIVAAIIAGMLGEMRTPRRSS